MQLVVPGRLSLILIRLWAVDRCTTHLSRTHVAHGTLQAGEHTHKRHGTERESPLHRSFLFFPYRRSQKGFYPLVPCMRMYTHMSSRPAEVNSLWEDMKRPQTDEPTHCPRGNRSLWKNKIAFLILCSIREAFFKKGRTKNLHGSFVSGDRLQRWLTQFHLLRWRLGVFRPGASARLRPSTC